MVEEKQYLIDTLKKAGITTPVYTTMKRLKTAHELQIGAVLEYDDHVDRSGSKKRYTDQEGQRKVRRKLWDRTTHFHVVIAETTGEKVEEIFVRFLTLLKKGLAVDRNWVDLEIGEIDWLEEGDSILKGKVAVQFDAIFRGGIYEERDLKTLSFGEVNEKRQEES